MCSTKTTTETAAPVQPKLVSVNMLRPFDMAGDGYPGEIEINGGSYQFEPVPAAVLPAGVSGQVRMWNHKDCYYLTMLQDGRADCACADFTFRYPKTGDVCKHLKAALATGLLADPNTPPADEPAPTDGDDWPVELGEPVAVYTDDRDYPEGAFADEYPHADGRWFDDFAGETFIPVNEPYDDYLAKDEAPF